MPRLRARRGHRRARLKAIIWNILSALLDPGDECSTPTRLPGVPAAAVLAAQALPVSLLSATTSRSISTSSRRACRAGRNSDSELAAQSDRRRAQSPRSRDDRGTRERVTASCRFRRDLQPQLVWGGSTRSRCPRMRERTIVLDGFSKAYAMTGWRLGYALMPAHIARIVSLLAQNTYSCTATFVQAAGIAALEGPDDSVVEMVEDFRRRRDAIVAGLNAIPGITCNTPDGAFYVFPTSARSARRQEARRRSCLRKAASRGSAGRVSVPPERASCASRTRPRSSNSIAGSSASARRCPGSSRSNARASGEDLPQVARATVDDVPALAPLFEAYRAFYRCEPGPEAAAAFLTERLTRNESVIFFARAEAKGAPIGFTQLYPNFSSLQLCRSWLLNALTSFPRRAAAASRPPLSRAPRTRTRNGSPPVLELSTHQSNRSAQRVYSGAGCRATTTSTIPPRDSAH